MWQSLVVLIFACHVFLITPTEATCKKCHKPNEVYDPCPALCPPRQCGVRKELIKCAAPPKVGDPECKPGCRCIDGYVKNKDGVCIPEGECPKRCPKNETLDPCLNTCPPRYCGVNIAAVLCAAIPPESCSPGCRCKDGYLRNGDGLCVKEKDCPVCEKPNEIYDVCPAPCPPRRCDVDERVIRCAAPPEPGDPKCEPGCRCADGYVRNADGVCVTRDQCTITCGDNEVSTTCSVAVCRPQDCTEVGFPVACPDLAPGVCPTRPSCICDTGFVRNGTGLCVPTNECPSCGGDPNAVAGCGVNCGKHCSDRDNTEPVACILVCYENACDCKDGYWYDDNTGKCVPPDQCSPTCGKDEIYSECINSDCLPQNCSQVGYPISCPRLDPAFCIKGCLCKAGFVRADNGTCIPIQECPSCGGDKNAVSGCGVNCGRHCSDLISKEPKACIEICYINGCDCKDGFVIDDSTGKCIPPEKCVSCRGDVNAKPGCDTECKNRCPGPKVKKCRCQKDPCQCKDGFVFDPQSYKCVRPEQCTPVCGKNEVFSNCSNGGCGPWTCDDLGFPTGCVKMHPDNCKEGCVCQPGFVRNSEGNCIPSTECPQCGGDPNAIAGCGINCGRLCSNYNKGPVACLAICKENACDCKDGYVYDEKINKCVLPQECSQCSMPHEVYDPCPPTCPPQTCESIGKKYFCPKQPVKGTQCKGACRCEPGYYRNKIGECILEEDCLKCTGPNEYFSCGGACDNICATITTQNQTNCPIQNIVCNPMCYCEEGYARDNNNICIPIKDCPAPCGVNERYEICPDWLCQPQSCEQLGFPLICPELPNDSSTPCPGSPACVCDFNFVRNKQGVCIPKEQCPSCGGDSNAVSGCGINCGRLCSNYDKGPVPCPRICKINSCDCKDGYVYDENINKCVRPKNCSPICGDNEVFSTCTNGGCGPKNCTQLGKPVPCVKIDPKYCKKGCICAEGYLRNANGVCVPEDQCNPKECPSGEILEQCPDRLCIPQTCSQLGFPLPCDTIDDNSKCPGPPKCICDNGNVRNDDGKCVPREECPSCGGDPNAVSGCGGHCGNRCSNYKKKPVICPLSCRLNGCDCKKGYVYDDNLKKCVRPKDCTPICSKDEVYSECINGGCQAKNCSQLGKPVPCIKIDPKFCIKGCLCKEGYLRLDNGTCVPQDQCTTNGCGPDERLEQCPERLCIPQTCSQLGFPLPCDFSDNNSVCPGPPQCVCDNGNVRNDDGQCVPRDECPSCGGDPNAVSGCGGHCGNRCSNYKKKPVICPLLCQLNGCDCKKGFVYDDNLKKCVRPKQCTPVCGSNEVYDTCANGGCQKRNCSQVDQPRLCIDPIKCIGGCVCQEGFLRAENGACVPENECPNKCTGPNEYFSCGSACDNVCSTLSKQNQTNCPIKNKKCVNKCYCEEGYARDDNNVCIPIDQCGVSCNGDPNAVQGCGTYCGNRCSDYKNPPLECPIGCQLNGCSCKKNYVYEDNIGRCVQPKDCPPSCPNPNEVYNSCANGGCRRRNCSDLTGAILCIDPIECIGGCICMEGYLKNEDGVCVPESQCNPQCNRQNEVFSTCTYSCPPQTCESLSMAYICPIEQGAEPPCEPGCVCKSGFYRNKIGDCISEQECLQCMGPHEYFSCGGACDNVCETLNEQSQDNCPIINIVCNRMCYCESGYARNASNICIPIEECPPSRCGVNERYEESPSKVCEPLTCEEVGSEIDCPPVEDPDCEDTPGCICKYGMVRNENNICIPISECPVSSTTSPEPTTAVNITDARARFDIGSIEFSNEVLYQLLQSKPDENIIASGTSVLTPTALLTMFSRTGTAVHDQLFKLLNLKNNDEIRAVFTQLGKEYDNQENIEFKVANICYANDGFPLSDNFLSDAKTFNAEAQNINFSQNVQAAETINDWVENKTNGRIKDLVQPDMFNQDTRLVLVNAIYLLGNWVHQFNPNNTETKDFTKSNGDLVPIEFMYQQNSFNYFENDMFQAVQLPYKGNSFSFLAILPRTNDGLLSVVDYLRDATKFIDVVNKMTYEKVQVTLPKFIINTDIDVGEILKKDNVTAMFDPNNNGFEGILTIPEPLYVSKVVQKAFIKVNEVGTEAAAATAIMVGTTSAINSPIYQFEATRSFAYYILLHNMPIFCGAFVGAK